MYIYVAALLFNEMERERNTKFNKRLKKLGFKTYLPQEDGGVAYDMIKEGKMSKQEVRQYLFDTDYKAVQESDIIICLLDGRTPDEGTCIELGMAYAMGKICIAYKTDSRAMDQNGDNNVMIDGCFNHKIYTNIKDLTKYLLEIKKWKS